MLLFKGHLLLLFKKEVVQQIFINLCLLIILPLRKYENGLIGPDFQQEGPEPKRMWSPFLGTQDSIK